MGNDATSHFAVSSLGALRLRAGWRSAELHSNPSHRLFWITRGTGRLSVHCITRGFGPNTAVFVPAGVTFSIELPTQVQGLLLELPADPFLKLPQSAFHLRISQIESQVNLTGFIDKFEREIAAAAPAMDRALMGHALLLSAWFERELANQKGDIGRDRSHRLIEGFSTLMEKELRSGHGITEFAAKLDVTPTHLSRVCRQAAGRPAHALLSERLTREAKQLLADTKMNAKEIAEYLGFSSAAYFTRAFGQSVGTTPSAFRKNLRP